MIIKLIRHGETEYNSEHRYQGQTDIPLSESGRTKLRTAKILPDIVYTSMLMRTRETADIVFPGVRQIVAGGIEEMDFGSFEGKTYDELKDNPDYSAWLDSGGMIRVPGGESGDEYISRTVEALIRIIDECSQVGYEFPAIVAHGGTIMAGLNRFEGRGEYYEWLPEPGGGYEIEVIGTGPDMKWHVKKRISYAAGSGLTHLYYGEGRGKSSIAAGTALRSLDADMPVYYIQLCKSGNSGEIRQLSGLGAKVYIGKEELGFASGMNTGQKAAVKERQTLLLKEIIYELRAIPSSQHTLLVIDEACAALEYDLIDEDLLWDAVLRKPALCDIILTGRHPAQWMIDAADYCSEIHCDKHPYTDGIIARSGIEY